MSDSVPELATLTDRILGAAEALLSEGGREALTTRAVAAAAGLQAPAIYRLFGNKEGLLDAVAERGWAAYIVGKADRPPLDDPLEDFRAGWDLHVAFALAHPALFGIINDPNRPNGLSAAAIRGIDVVRARIRRIAAAGLLRVPEDRAMGIVRSLNLGAIQSLIELPVKKRDLALPTAAREVAITAITTAAGPGEKHWRVAAITLRAVISDVASLTPGERLIMAELLDRIGMDDERPPYRVVHE